MTPERWAKVKELFEAALACAPQERAAFLERSCPGDPSLRGEVEGLLAAHERPGSFLERPALPAETILPRRIGGTIGRYEVLKSIGAGGMGEVYLARDPVLDRHVAIKVVLGEDPSGAARLRREAQHASRLNHPNICTVHEVGEENGLPFIVMEFVEGRSLQESIPPGGFPLATALHLAVQIGAGLAHAHEHEIVHRDLKSSNVMVTRDGRIKLLDFGLAKRTRVGDAGGGSTLTGAGAIAGTIPYMAPELLRGARADGRSDVWAFGVVLHEIIAGRRPFAGDSDFELASAILKEPAAPLPARVPAGVRAVVERCLDKERERRFPDGTALEAVLRTLEQVTLPRRPPIRAAVAVVAIALTVVAGAYVSQQAPNRRSDAAPREVTAAPSLAVLQFADLSPGGGEEYFAAGITEGLVAQLARIPTLTLVPRSSVGPYKGTTKPLPLIARELHATAAVGGSVVRTGDRVRIAIHLAGARSDSPIWEKAWEGSLASATAVHREAALAIADALGVKVPAERREKLGSAAPRVNAAAYDDYLRALAYIGRVSRTDWRQAIDRLEHAVAVDPGYAPAYGLLATAYSLLSTAEEPQKRQALEAKARAAVDKALSLDPEVADAYVAQGRLIWTPEYGWPHERAIEAYRRAIDLQPDSDFAHRQLAIVYEHVGLTGDALAELRRSETVPATLLHLGLTLRAEGKIDEALATWLSIPVGARQAMTAAHLAWALTDVGRAAEARTVLDEGLRTDPHNPDRMLQAADAYWNAAAGRRLEAERMIAAVVDASGADLLNFHHATYLVATAYVRLGNAAEALRWLRYTAANGFPCYPLFANDRNLDPIRSSAGFAALLEELRTRWQGYRSRLGAR
ncbi:MAG TPA: protein kinase [Gemmatimonadales bacterium]|nr:protein kinase [Gemmatimonadales bacterium]